MASPATAPEQVRGAATGRPFAEPGLWGLLPRVPLRDLQEAASHADPRTTVRYDRARTSLDRHATYIVATYIAGAAR
jgi:hypothetical protein